MSTSPDPVPPPSAPPPGDACQWTTLKGGDYEPSCPGGHVMIWAPWDRQLMQFCPHCGKRIEEKYEHRA